MKIEVKPVRTKAELKEFIHFPWQIYKGNKCWVPPLIKDMKSILLSGGSLSQPKETLEFFIAYLDGKAAGRIYATYDKKLNMQKSMQMGHFSFFECIDHQAVATALFDAAASWLRDRGIKTLHGPVGHAGVDSDENKGLLINAFDRPAYIMNSYNPPYYAKLIEGYGFVKDYDVYAYHLDPQKLFSRNPAKAIEYSQKKYNYRVDPIDFNNLEEEVKALKYVLDLAIPDDWPDLIAPSLDDVRDTALKLKPVADSELVLIARSGQEPIGFCIALPDYNQVLIHMNGRMNPVSVLKYLWYKRKINRARFFIMFVIPAFRQKGVSYALYYKLFEHATRKGYKVGEGSTIGETNLQMRKDIESFGGQHDKTYRIYKKDIG